MRTATRLARRSLRCALLLAVSASSCAVVGQSATPPGEGLSVQGAEVVSASADRVKVSLVLTAVGRTPEDAARALDAIGRELQARLTSAAPTAGEAQVTPQIADLPAIPAADGRSWSAVREVRATLSTGAAQALLPTLSAMSGVAVRSVAPTHGDLEGLRRAAIGRATAAAQARGETAARGLGFVLGAVRDVAVKTEERWSEAMVDLEARVDIRYALTPATTRAEVLAIAAAAQPSASVAPGIAAPADVTAAPAASAVRQDPAPRPLQVEVVAAVYDSTGRGRFTTASGTVWREVVPAPSDQRLRPGRRYRGTITLGLFSGYRMQLEGVPRILKVEPVDTTRP